MKHARSEGNDELNSITSIFELPFHTILTLTPPYLYLPLSPRARTTYLLIDPSISSIPSLPLYLPSYSLFSPYLTTPILEHPLFN